MKITDLETISEQTPMTAPAAQPPGNTAPTAGQPQTGLSPQQQMAAHQKAVQAKKKELTDQITDLNKQMAELRKQLADVR